MALKKSYQYKRNSKTKLINILHFLYIENKHIPFETLQDIYYRECEESLSRSTFYKLVSEFNDMVTPFKIVHKKGYGTNKGFKLISRDTSVAERSTGTNYILEKFADKEEINVPHQFADDVFYSNINKYTSKLSIAIKNKNTVSIKFFEEENFEKREIKNLTPIYFVFKPNKVWMYYSSNYKFYKVNLHLVFDITIEEGNKEQFDLISASDFCKKYLDIHGYFKDELKKLKVILPTEEKHIQFHQFLMEQNFQRYYSSWKDKTDGLYYTEFKSLSKDQIKLFKSISNLIKNS